jgi:uncharacterized protein YndB with AHSA1/START domain
VSDATDDDTTLRLERQIALPPEELWALWTDPEQLLRWWGPDGYACWVRQFDARVGGQWRIELRRPDGSSGATSGVFRVLEPPHRLAYTWAWDDPSGRRGHESEVTVTFEPAPGGTRLVLMHQRFDTRQARDNHGRGWTNSLDHLSKLMS